MWRARAPTSGPRTSLFSAEIVAVVSHSIFSNYFNHIAGTEVDFPSLEEETEAA